MFGVFQSSSSFTCADKMFNLFANAKYWGPLVKTFTDFVLELNTFLLPQNTGIRGKNVECEWICEIRSNSKSSSWAFRSVQVCVASAWLGIYLVVKWKRFWSHTVRMRALPSPLTSHETLGKLLITLPLAISSSVNGAKKGPWHRGCFKVWVNPYSQLALSTCLLLLVCQ